MNKTYHGANAVKIVEKKLGRKLTLAERRIVEEEGYSEGAYKDTKGIKTVGVGQTGKFAGMPLDKVFSTFEGEARRYIKNFNALPEEVRAELVQAAYRGDIQQSPTFRKLFNEGRYAEAAQEFLNNKEYQNTQSAGLKARFEKVANAVKSLAKPQQTAFMSQDELLGTPSYMQGFGGSNLFG